MNNIIASIGIGVIATALAIRHKFKTKQEWDAGYWMGVGVGAFVLGALVPLLQATLN